MFKAEPIYSLSSVDPLLQLYTDYLCHNNNMCMHWKK